MSYPLRSKSPKSPKSPINPGPPTKTSLTLELMKLRRERNELQDNLKLKKELVKGMKDILKTALDLAEQIDDTEDGEL